MVRFAVPSIIALVVNSLYNMVDQIFIGNDVGYLGNAATNVILPIMTIVLAVGLRVRPIKFPKAWAMPSYFLSLLVLYSP